MNRKQRKARKMFLRRFGKASNPSWQSQARARLMVERKIAELTESLRAQAISEAYRT